MLRAEDALPSVLESFFINTTVNRESYIVTYWDTCTMRSLNDMHMDLIKLKPLEYENTDVFLACFDVSNPTSFQNISTVWVPEVKHYVPGTPLIVVGNKVDLRCHSKTAVQMLSTAKGIELAKRLETEYCETSSFTGQGLREMIGIALRKAVLSTVSLEKKPKRKLRMFLTRPVKIFYTVVEPPSLPRQAPDEIVITIPTSAYASNMTTLLCSGCCADLTLKLMDVTFQAHRIILCLASPVFLDLLLKGSVLSDQLIHLLTPQQKQVNSSSVTNFEAFKHFLDFLYTFDCKPDQKTNQSVVKEMLKMAEIAKIPELAQCCENALNKQDYLNNRICNIANERRKQTMRELFLNKPLLSDVKFLVEGKRVYAHKAVVMARSDVMSAMLGGGFKEGSTDKEGVDIQYRFAGISNKYHFRVFQIRIEDTTEHAFVDLLEYLYTDSLPRKSRDFRQLLVLSDKFCLPRLRALCELAIFNELKVEIRKKLHLSTETCRLVLHTLLFAEAHNATQLYDWCNYIVTINFSDFEFHEDLTLLKPQDREKLANHRWPPVSYLKELEEYKRKTRK
ncbi:hypothetical protein QZH41_017361 [Actinostola sp. cb2023]|nr:hypothetical protein QZH41_017361 [Actinostola sp. cb2023]